MYERNKINLILFVIFICSSALSAEIKSGDDRVLASIGTHKISLTEFKQRYNNFITSTDNKDNLQIREAILNNMINEILLYEYDSNENLFADNNYVKEQEWNRRKVILAYLKEQEIYSKITVADPELRESFLRVNETLSARHLYAATESEANELYELVKNGASFESLSKTVFTDSALKNNGGYLGYFTWGDMDPAFEDAAYSLQVNEISAPVRTAQGYSIIKLESRSQKPLLTEYEFQNKKAHLEKVLRLRKKSPAEKEYVYSVFKKDLLTFNEDGLNQLVQNIFVNNETGTQQSEKNKLCVSYDSRNYNVEEIENKLLSLPDEQLDRITSVEILKASIEGILINEILYSIALEKGYDTAQPVLSMLDGYRKKTFLELKMNEITGNSVLPDSVLLKYYRENIHNFSREREINIQEIIVDRLGLADSLFNSLKQGEDFGKLAKQFSLRRWSAENEGVMGSSPISKYGNLKELFWKSGVGELLGPLQIENMFGIFRIIGKKDSEPIDFELVKEDVLKAAQSEKRNELVKTHIDKLKEKVKVVIDYDLLHSYNILG